MKGSSGAFVVGILVGAIGALLAVKLRQGDLHLDLEGLGESIQDNLEELESRVRDIVSTEPAT